MGVEGYIGNVATGLVAAVNLARVLQGQPEWILPPTSMLGALCHYVTNADPKYFQPMKANFGIMPNLPERAKVKRDRYNSYSDRALEELAASIANDPSFVSSIPMN